MVDTNVWSKLFVPNTRTSPVIPQVTSWRGKLTGFTVVIATQTRAEILYGMEKAGWGVMRRSGVEAQLAATTVIPVNEAVISAYVKFRAECGRRGHHFQDSANTADTWIAAIAIGAALLTDDSDFSGAPGLTLL